MTVAPNLRTAEQEPSGKVLVHDLIKAGYLLLGTQRVQLLPIPHVDAVILMCVYLLTP